MSRITRMFRDLARFSSGPRQRPLPYAAAGLSETPLPRDIFLTDDDGPTAATEVMLDILGEESVPATFFLTGEHAAGLGRRDRQKRLVQRILREGHLIGNHGFRHFPESRSVYAEVYGDLSDVRQQAAFAANLDKNLAFFQDLLGDSGSSHAAYATSRRRQPVAPLRARGFPHRPEACGVGRGICP